MKVKKNNNYYFNKLLLVCNFNTDLFPITLSEFHKKTIRLEDHKISLSVEKDQYILIEINSNRMPIHWK